MRGMRLVSGAACGIHVSIAVVQQGAVHVSRRTVQATAMRTAAGLDDGVPIIVARRLWRVAPLLSKVASLRRSKMCTNVYDQLYTFVVFRAPPTGALCPAMLRSTSLPLQA